MSNAMINDNICKIQMERQERLKDVKNIPKKMILGILIFLLLRTIFVLPVFTSSNAVESKLTFSKAFTQRYVGNVPEYEPTRKKIANIFSSYNKNVPDLFIKVFKSYKFDEFPLIKIVQGIIYSILYISTAILLLIVGIILAILCSIGGYVIAPFFMLFNLIVLQTDKMLPQLNVVLLYIMLGAGFGITGSLKRKRWVPRALYYAALIGIYIYSTKYLIFTNGIALNMFYR